MIIPDMYTFFTYRDSDVKELAISLHGRAGLYPIGDSNMRMHYNNRNVKEQG
jgi:hypothetical protein